LNDEVERNQILLHLPLMNELLHLDYAQNSTTLALSSEFTEDERLDIVSTILFRVVECITERHPSAIVVDDAAV
jgi:hypothetical protein